MMGKIIKKNQCSNETDYLKSFRLKGLLLLEFLKFRISAIVFQRRYFRENCNKTQIKIFAFNDWDR